MSKWLDQAKMQKARRTAVAKGRHGGGPVPYGYMIRDGVIERDTDERDVVRMIFDIYAGYNGGRKNERSIRDVVLALEAMGEKTRSGKPWSKAAVGTVLRNPIYIGQRRFGGQVFEGTHKPTVDIRVWRAAQKKLTGQRRGGKPAVAA